jgi:translation initiation factor 3 subunit M
VQAFNNQKFAQPLDSLVALLRIICDGSLEEYLAFQTANASLFATYKLDTSAIERNIKLLALCSLAAQATDKTVTYEAIRAALKIDLSEVELWTIEAISENLLEASIDQLTSTVTIK